MQQQAPPRLPQRLRQLLKIELFFTALPLVGFPIAFFLLGAVFPPAAIMVLFAGFLYLMPAYVVVNVVFGYRTVEGAPPLPVPASSLSSLLVVVAAHAGLVAAAFVAYRVGAGLLTEGLRPGAGVNPSSSIRSSQPSIAQGGVRMLADCCGGLGMLTVPLMTAPPMVQSWGAFMGLHASGGISRDGYEKSDTDCLDRNRPTRRPL